MRILRFMGYPISNFSTLELMMLRQAKALAEQGHQVEIAFDGVRRPEAAAAARAFAPEIKLHFDLPDRFGIGKPIESMRYARAVSRLIGNGGYDVVHVYFDPSARVVNQVARFHPRVRFVRSLGSTPLLRGQWRQLDALKRRKWIFDTAQMSKLICVGHHISDMMAGYGIERERLAVVPNATDVERFQRRVPHSHGDILRLGFVGRMSAVKNLPLIIEGMRLLIDRGVSNVRLKLVGAGQEREKMMALTAEYDLEAYITFAGQVDDIPSMLNNEIDLYVQASLNEGCPAAVIEAMACEVPVLLSDIPGHRQVAEPDQHATYFPVNDSGAFADAVMRIDANFSHYSEIAVRARKHIVETYGIDAWIAKELAVYKSILAAA